MSSVDTICVVVSAGGLVAVAALCCISSVRWGRTWFSKKHILPGGNVTREAFIESLLEGARRGDGWLPVPIRLNYLLPDGCPHNYVIKKHMKCE